MTVPARSHLAYPGPDVAKQRPGKKGKFKYVFQAGGSGSSHNWLRDELIRTARRAEIPDLTKVHTLRHNFASHLVMNGVDLPTVGKLMCHSDVETTMIYAHPAPEYSSEAIVILPFSWS